MGDVPTKVAVDFYDIGFTIHSGKALEIYDCMEHKDIGRKTEILSETVAAYGAKVYRCKVVSGS